MRPAHIAWLLILTDQTGGGKIKCRHGAGRRGACSPRAWSAACRDNSCGTLQLALPPTPQHMAPPQAVPHRPQATGTATRAGSVHPPCPFPQKGTGACSAPNLGSLRPKSLNPHAVAHPSAKRRRCAAKRASRPLSWRLYARHTRLLAQNEGAGEHGYLALPGAWAILCRAVFTACLQKQVRP